MSLPGSGGVFFVLLGFFLFLGWESSPKIGDPLSVVLGTLKKRVMLDMTEPVWFFSCTAYLSDK